MGSREEEGGWRRGRAALGRPGSQGSGLPPAATGPRARGRGTEVAGGEESVTESSRALLPPPPRESLSQTPGSQVRHVHVRGGARSLTMMPAATGLVRGTGRPGNHHHHHRYVPAFSEVRRLSNSEKSSLIVPFKLLKRSKAPGERVAVTVWCPHFSALCFPSGGRGGPEVGWRP